MSSDFSKTKSALTRNANKIAAGLGITLKGKVDFIGSFASYRIDDPEGIVTMKQASALRQPVAQLISEAGFAIDTATGQPGYHMDGVVFTWMRK